MDIQYQWRNKSDAGLSKIIGYFLESRIGLETLRAVVNFVMRGRKFLEARTHSCLLSSVNRYAQV